MDAAGEFSIVTRNLEKRFDRFVAVHDVSLEIKKGEIFGFLGPNGAGKSTIIKMLCGILVPTSGSGSVAGFDLRTETEKIKTRIGYMSQKFSLYEDLTVEENIDFYSGVYRIEPEKARARKAWVMQTAGLEERRGSITGTLPGGWKQRLSLGCAILHEPPVVFLDEPTSGVDPLSRRRFWSLIRSLADVGVTVFVTTHYMDEAEYCDRLGMIYAGELIAVGTPEELKTRFMKEDILEIRCERPVDAMDALLKMEGIHDVALFGDTIHAVSEGGEKTAVSIRDRLDAAGFAAEKIGKILPSLEDVFVSLIERWDRENAGKRENVS